MINFCPQMLIYFEFILCYNKFLILLTNTRFICNVQRKEKWRIRGSVFAHPGDLDVIHWCRLNV